MGGIHMGASAAFLNGTGPVGHNGDFNLIESKKSIDQYIADAIAGDTPLRSLELGTEDMGTSAGACDGYPCVFFNTMAWYDDSSPLPVSVNPQATFERMFGDPGTPEQRLARLQAKQSMLDSVMHETSRLQKVIGAKDNAILDEYLTNIRRVEDQLQKMQARSSALTSAADGPVGIPEDFNDHMTVTYDLLHIAFQGDISRVFSLMLGHEGSGRSYAHVGVKEPHHSTSHHKNTPESIDQYARITAYQMVKLGEFLEKLKTTPDGDGTLLDSSLDVLRRGHEQRLAARSAQRAGRADRWRQRPAGTATATSKHRSISRRRICCSAWPTCSAPRSRRSASRRAA